MSRILKVTRHGSGFSPPFLQMRRTFLSKTPYPHKPVARLLVCLVISATFRIAANILNFSHIIASSVAPPAGTFTATSTNSVGVPQDPTGGSSVDSSATTLSSIDANDFSNSMALGGVTSSSDNDIKQLVMYAMIVLGLIVVAVVLSQASVITSIGSHRIGTRSDVYHPPTVGITMMPSLCWTSFSSCSVTHWL